MGDLSNVKRKYAQIDFRLAAGLSKILEGTLADTVNRYTKLYKRTYHAPLTGRQILCLIHQHYQTTDDPSSMYRPKDLLGVEFSGDSQIETFLNNWHRVYGGLCCDLPESFAEDHFINELRKSTVLKEIVAHYDRLPLGDPDKSYNGLLAAVNSYLLRVRQEANRVKLLGKSGRTAAPFEGPKQLCDHFKAGNCSRGRNCPFSHSKRKKKAALRKEAAPAPPPKGKGKGQHGKSREPSPFPDQKGNKGKGKGGGGRKGGNDNSQHGNDTRRPCFAFADGRCQKGRDCMFVHRALTADEIRFKDEYRKRADSPGNLRKQAAPVPKGVCELYLENKCRLGKSCPMAHIKLKKPAKQDATPVQPNNPSNAVPLQHYNFPMQPLPSGPPFMNQMAPQGSTASTNGQRSALSPPQIFNPHVSQS